MIRPVSWKNDGLYLIDQTLLPHEYREIRIETQEQLWEAIQSLRVRGAPAIGIAAAFGIALEAHQFAGTQPAECLSRIEQACDYLATSRPTAVNLFWALDRMRHCARRLKDSTLKAIQAELLTEAQAILDEDIRMGEQMGNAGAELLKDGDVVLTHCNAGALATGGFGTALGVIYAAAKQGKRIHVYADETRPLLQGARLTAWELLQNGIEVTLICDNAAASVMQSGKIHAVIVGADRIAANGDFANKIGTYGVAVLAHAHGIPFYTAAPWSTLDLSLNNGSEIPIEMRSADEVRSIPGGPVVAPPQVSAHNPAFDVTPAKWLTAIITERGVAYPPFRESLKQMDEQDVQRK